jgi:hypothetical protein
MRLISDVQCRRQLGISRVKWTRWQKVFADVWPEAIEINGRLHRDGDRWDHCVEVMVERSDPSVTRASAARARAGLRRREAAP